METYEPRNSTVLAVQLTRNTFWRVRDIVEGRVYTSDESIMFNEDGLDYDLVSLGQWVVYDQGKIEIMEDIPFQLKYQKKD